MLQTAEDMHEPQWGKQQKQLPAACHKVVTFPTVQTLAKATLAKAAASKLWHLLLLAKQVSRSTREPAQHLLLLLLLSS